jgi:hypothetical protein
MGLQGYSATDLARLRSVQANAGRTRAVRREPIVDGRRIRIVRRLTDSGAVVLTREYHQVHDQHKDVTVRVPVIRGVGGVQKW